MTPTLHPTLHRLFEAQSVDADRIMRGLKASTPTLPFWLFYDELGSELFRQITMTPEYYLTRTEKQILLQYGAEIASVVGSNKHWIEPGAGCCDKARLILKHARAQSFNAIDVSEAALMASAETLQKEHPMLAIQLFVANFDHQLSAVIDKLPTGERVVFYPGSSIGNFAPEEAIVWLAKLRALAGNNGQLLLGFDCPKDPAALEAAYNDGDGVTERFHLNILAHLQSLGFQVNAQRFSHVAKFNAEESRIEMRLQVSETTEIRFKDDSVVLVTGQDILTEYSYKYSLAVFQALAVKAGWRLTHSWQDARQYFCVARFVV